MLVLTRRTSESIMIGNDVVITVLEIRGDQVRIGIDAPRSVKVHREEVFQQVAAENQAAAQANPAARQLLQRRLRPATPPRPAAPPPLKPEDAPAGSAGAAPTPPADGPGTSTEDA